MNTQKNPFKGTNRENSFITIREANLELNYLRENTIPLLQAFREKYKGVADINVVSENGVFLLESFQLSGFNSLPSG